MIGTTVGSTLIATSARFDRARGLAVDQLIAWGVLPPIRALALALKENRWSVPTAKQDGFVGSPSRSGRGFRCAFGAAWLGPPAGERAASVGLRGCPAAVALGRTGELHASG